MILKKIYFYRKPPPSSFYTKIGWGYILKKLINNHSPEMEAFRELKYKLKKWDQKKFETKVKDLENKPKPEWMKHVENTR
jgi:hypothetical protein